jgi:urease gamma subunit
VTKFLPISLAVALLSGLAIQGTRAEQSVDDVAAIKSIIISNASLHKGNNRIIDDITLSFTITNNSKVVVKSFSLHGRLQTPGRTLPWIEADANYTPPGGLEPGEKRHLDLSPNMMSDWAKAEDEWLKTGKLNLEVVSIVDSNGRTITRPEGSTSSGTQP